IKDIYDTTVFLDQKVDWTTYPSNMGHINSPGCFRCHDGKHLDSNKQAIRLECNLCHSIPVVAGQQDFVANIEINRGIEPESHLNANWIALHNQALDSTCANCHTTDDPGGTSNTSFCSNSACHGSKFTYARLDAPELREALVGQLPTPEPAATLPPVQGVPTFEAQIGPLLASRCTMCHGASASAGLNLSTYADAMKGSQNGPVIIAGDSAGSKIVQVQSGTHFANLTADELALLIQWIDAGAPEK
ncbi:MAG: c-type cytochrome domain-containing protein, partial [Bacteroidota bacterium]